MSFLLILKIICAIGTVGVGVISLVAPRSIKGFTGLEATGPRGITEIRAVLGALFIGIGLAPFLLGNAPAVYQALGIMYLAIGVVRAASMVLDKSIMQSNTISLIVEIIFGVILVL
jgi:hypothetical protein